jgi:hypothetical protein
VFAHQQKVGGLKDWLQSSKLEDLPCNDGDLQAFLNQGMPSTATMIERKASFSLDRQTGCFLWNQDGFVAQSRLTADVARIGLSLSS